MVEHWIAVKSILLLHNTYSYYTIATLYHIFLVTLPFMQCEVQSGYSVHPCLFIDQRLLLPVQRQPGDIRQICTTTSSS